MNSRSLKSIFRRHYIPGLMLGVITLSLLDGLVSPEVVSGFDTRLEYELACLFSGSMAALITVMFHLYRNHKVLHRKTVLFRHLSSRREIFLAGVSSGISGAACLLLFASPYWSISLCVVTLIIVLYELKEFTKKLFTLLAPGTYPTWEDVGQIADAYIIMLAAYTITNINLSAFHRLFENAPPAFSFDGVPSLADFIYFSVVVMTTLGFGDIHPVTSDAKLLVSFECLVGYVMFALIVGVITRGIVSTRKQQTSVSVSEAQKAAGKGK